MSGDPLQNFHVTLANGKTILVKSTTKNLPHIAPKPPQQNADEEDDVFFICPSCPKTFYNKIALRNHHNLMHGPLCDVKYEAIAQQVLIKTEVPVSTETEPSEQAGEWEEKDRDAIPVTVEDAQKLVSLASQDISYIIVKTGTGKELTSGRKRRRTVGTPLKRSPQKLKTDVGPLQVNGPFVCQKKSGSEPRDVCTQKFTNCCEYTMHYSKEHTKKRKPGLKCQVCEKELETEALELAEVNPRPRPWVCSLCSKAFTQQGGLIQHMRMHTGQRPFPCTVCDKHFTQKAGLDQHMRTHTKVKPFACVVCDKGFAQAIHLRQHMRTHTNITPFQCAVCKRRFKQASHLNFHLRTHQTELSIEESEVPDDKETEEVGIEYMSEHENAAAVEIILGE